MKKNMFNIDAFVQKWKADKKFRKNVCMLLLLVILLIGIWVITARGLKNKPVPYKQAVSEMAEEDRYFLAERTTAEFSPVIIEKFREESELVVLTADTSQTIDLKQMGIFDWDVLNKTQSLTFKASGSFYVDLSVLGENSIRLDNENKSVIITIPHAKMAPADIDPDKFEAGEVQKGLLAMGELKFTPQEYNKLEKEAKARINKALNTEENLKKADERSKEEMKKLYDPLVQAIDEDYQVQIQFVN